MSHTQSMKEHGESTAEFSMLNIDSAAPARLARFYAAALGWEVTYSDDSNGMVEGNGIKIGFGKVEGFRPAQWPDGWRQTLPPRPAGGRPRRGDREPVRDRSQPT